MSETHLPPRDGHSPKPVLPLGHHASTHALGTPMLLKFGGGLGIAGSVVGLGVLLAACAGMSAALRLAWVPIALGAVGFVVAVVGANVEKRKVAVEDTHVLAALFACCMSIIGGLVELAALKGWRLLP